MNTIIRKLKLSLMQIWEVCFYLGGRSPKDVSYSIALLRPLEVLARTNGCHPLKLLLTLVRPPTESLKLIPRWIRNSGLRAYGTCLIHPLQLLFNQGTMLTKHFINPFSHVHQCFN